MPRAAVSYEVQLFQNDRWQVADCLASEEDARAAAQRLFQNPACAGYRVVRDRLRPDGTHDELVLQVEYRALRKPLTIAAIDDAPACGETRDLYRPESRQTINRLFRSYFDQRVLTPTEVLHDHRELKRLLDHGTLVSAAVGRVATLQAAAGAAPAPGGGNDARARRQHLEAMLAEALARTKGVAARRLPDLAQTPLSELRPLLLGKVPEAELEFLSLAALAQALTSRTSWLSKLEFLLERIELVLEPDPTVALFDGVIAELVGIPAVIQELLGAQPSLARALRLLVALSRGTLGAESESAEGGSGLRTPPLHPLAPRLNAVLAGSGLPLTAAALLELVRRQLAGAQPLNRGADPLAEKAAFDQLAHYLTRPEGMTGGPPMAEALLARFGRFLEAGGATGRRQAIAGILLRYRSPRDQLRFLLALAASDTGRQHSADVAEQLERVLNPNTDSAVFFDPRQPAEDNLRDGSHLYRLALASPLEHGAGARCAELIDGLLCEYIRRFRVIEQIDTPEAHLRRRANSLIALCCPELLGAPRSLELVRRRVIAHLRQPAFEEKYVDDIAEPAEQAHHLRELFRLLTGAGFR